MAAKHCQLLSTADGAKAGKQYKILVVYPKLKSYLMKKRKLLEIAQLNTTEIKIIVKSKIEGFLIENHVKPGDVIELGCKLISVEDCLHPTVLGNICCDCGTVLDVDINEECATANTLGHVSMLHSIPDLKVSRKEAERLGAEDISNLLERRRLVLLVDLDQTLIHTTNDNIPPKLKDVYHFQFIANGPWYHTRLRPYTQKFLEKISEMYELHICTFGVREYAHSIARYLDPQKKLFGHRILSRNECLDPMSKKANLNSLFPCGGNLVCIIDDRSDVWNFAPNVVQVLPYHFFKHTGDINAPPGLQKKEDDEEKGFDFAHIESKLSESEKSYAESETVCVQKPSSTTDGSLTKNEKEPDHDSSLETSISSSTKKDNSETESESIKGVETSSEKSETSSEKSDSKVDGESNVIDKDDNENMTISTAITKNKDDGENTKNNTEDETCDTTEKRNNSEVQKDVEAKEFSTEDKDDGKVEKVTEGSKKKMADEFIEVPDDDDCLLYLEDILKKLHSRFYKYYDDTSGSLPDLKQIVPNVRAEVLVGVNITFSSIIPNHISLTNSKAYHVARSLGANVTERIRTKPHQFPTTHLIAANLHTEKSKQAVKLGLKIVNPNWLWCCAERWEMVGEVLFTLENKNFERNPPLHCLQPNVAESDPGTSNEGKSETNLIENINPLMYFSEFDTKDMKADVDVCLSDDSDNDDEESFESSPSHYEESSDDSQQCRKRKRDDEDDTADSDDDELPSVVFRQGDVPSDLSDDSENDEDLNAYGDILEREMMD